tara:strand:+ start:37811 stop:38599 length:789 start_codon:yes stop_codon:yes gene_type:complete
MSDPSSVFGEQQEQEQTTAQPEDQPQGGQQQPNNPPQQDPYADLLTGIVNERGEPKYRDIPTALKALGHSQEYIANLQRENDELKKRQDAEKAEEDRIAQIEESLRRLAESQQSDQPTPQEFKGLTEEQIDSLLQSRLSQHEQQKVASANIEKVSQAIRSQYGDKTQETVAQKAAAYGLSPQEFEQMAAKSPQMVLDIFGIKPQQNKQSFSSSVNIPPIKPNEEPSLTPPEKSLMRGATDKEAMDYMKKVRQEVYRRHGIEE